MSTYRELVYMCQDLLKTLSDDSVYTQEHILFLLGKFRGMLLKQHYKDIKKEIPESNYQTICLDLIEVPAISGELCEGGSYLRTTQKIPDMMTLGSTRVFTEDYYQGDISFVSRERMKYVGYNKWLQNIIYASIGPDNHLYLKSFNPQYLYLKCIKLTGIFEDPEKAEEASSCPEDNNENTCDPLDKSYPIEEALIPTLIELVVKELSGAVYKPSDTQNNSNDDLADLYNFLRKNMKSNMQKQIEGDS